MMENEKRSNEFLQHLRPQSHKATKPQVTKPQSHKATSHKTTKPQITSHKTTLILNQADRAPGYEPPKQIHLVDGGSWNCLVMAAWKEARSESLSGKVSTVQ